MTEMIGKPFERGHPRLGGRGNGARNKLSGDFVSVNEGGAAPVFEHPTTPNSNHESKVMTRAVANIDFKSVNSSLNLAAPLSWALPY